MHYFISIISNSGCLVAYVSSPFSSSYLTREKKAWLMGKAVDWKSVHRDEDVICDLPGFKVLAIFCFSFYLREVFEAYFSFVQGSIVVFLFSVSFWRGGWSGGFWCFLFSFEGCMHLFIISIVINKNNN